MGIGFEHNANLAIFRHNRSYWDRHETEIRIVHYTMNKPWKCSREYERACLWWKASCCLFNHRAACFSLTTELLSPSTARLPLVLSPEMAEMLSHNTTVQFDNSKHGSRSYC